MPARPLLPDESSQPMPCQKGLYTNTVGNAECEPGKWASTRMSQGNPRRVLRGRHLLSTRHHDCRARRVSSQPDVIPLRGVVAATLLRWEQRSRAPRAHTPRRLDIQSVRFACRKVPGCLGTTMCEACPLYMFCVKAPSLARPALKGQLGTDWVWPTRPSASLREGLLCFWSASALRRGLLLGRRADNRRRRVARRGKRGRLQTVPSKPITNWNQSLTHKRTRVWRTGP